jgi:hypothetical protein
VVKEKKEKSIQYARKKKGDKRKKGEREERNRNNKEVTYMFDVFKLRSWIWH